MGNQEVDRTPSLTSSDDDDEDDSARKTAREIAQRKQVAQGFLFSKVEAGREVLPSSSLTPQEEEQDFQTRSK